MPKYTQAGSLVSVSTPQGPDALLAISVSIREGLSQLFKITVDVIAEAKTAVTFEKLLGQPVLIQFALAGKKERFYHGICNRVSQGESDVEFTDYRLEVVPTFWLLTKRTQSRIFQQKPVPDILKEVLTGLDPKFEIRGTFHPRDYCVQYRETDFNFASRLMEEEGIFYFFTHAKDGHRLVLANTPASHPDVPVYPKITYKNLHQEGIQDEAVIYDWGKSQEITAGKVTLWDHCFELAHTHLEAEKGIQESVPVGGATHKLKVADNTTLELYDYPGEYAQRFDGVNPGGGDRHADLEKIFEDNARTAGIRMQQEAVTALVVQGASNCQQLTAGHKFTLTTVAGDPLVTQLKPGGAYVLTGVSHYANVGDAYRSGSGAGGTYRNTFQCIPLDLPFRPTRATPKPVVLGTQTAVVVGPSGEEIFTDKYGRVKVQFHWDREGKFDADSSCWVRVSQVHAGRGFGAMDVPRIGEEVIIAFMEGDPDQPIIIGRVYNSREMVPFGLPDTRMVSGMKSNTYPKGGGYNQMTMDDTKGKQKIVVHAQYDMDTTVQHDNSQTIVSGKHTFKVNTGTASYEVKDTVTETFHNTQSTTVQNTIDIKTLSSFIHVVSPTEIQLSVKASTVTLTPDTITLKSPNIVFEATTQIKGTAPKIAFVAENEALMSAPAATVSGGKTASLGVGSQSVVCDTSKVAVSGAAIASSATGGHDITGAVVKIN